MYYSFATFVALDFMAFFYKFGVAFDNGSPVATPAKPDPLDSHGLVRYIPHSQSVLLNSLNTISSIGIPAVIAVGFILHFFLRAKMFENMPTFEEWQKSGSRGTVFVPRVFPRGATARTPPLQSDLIQNARMRLKGQRKRGRTTQVAVFPEIAQLIRLAVFQADLIPPQIK